MLVPLVPRFRLPLHVWRNVLFGAAAILPMAFLATTAVLAQAPPVGATADVRDASGRLLANAEFREGRGEVVITMIFASPAALTGTHGLRIMSVGRCDPPDFTTAGAGFNPTNKKHGRQNPEGPQVGDLPNVNFSNGLTSYNTSALGATLGSGQTSLLGPTRTALVFFSGEDDQITDPDGKAGARIGCGVITAAAGGALGAAQTAVPKPTTNPVAAQAAQPAPAQPAAVAAAQPAPAKPASSPVVVAPPVVANPAAPKPATSPVAANAAAPTPTLFVPAVVLPTPPPLAAGPTTSGSGLGTGPALLIAVLGVGLVGAGYLLRRRSQLTR
jgi:Cu-Zn family superoxide dismutase